MEVRSARGNQSWQMSVQLSWKPQSVISSYPVQLRQDVFEPYYSQKALGDQRVLAQQQLLLGINSEATPPHRRIIKETIF